MPEQLPLAQWRDWWKRKGERELRDLLLLWWDPLGMYDDPDAQDEYDSYVGPVARMLREGARAAAIAEYLDQMAREDIGLTGSGNRRSEYKVAAQKIVEWHDQVLRQIDRWPDGSPRATT
jgi:hypothetical protein